ncbi:Anaerobic glycerol-3-phosphate dehydrogenase subunit C [Candidatus Bealeia paramacronuclearis]|uniref:Anaerobic glycerol-3-phosphate dehydrogenase subunit C n=1 Tax=Candidatus Bealeia paramacronuclearis TaxID=1921001 RepID=A0ABZ2C428_9PROT|nr:Anaerobic glycerol-3-phosphate dehydrogenase subunit C [Candidatus Bealeia paramacronuclearis]
MSEGAGANLKEGGLHAPLRHPLDWKNPDFYDEEKLDAELRRVFDICHGCRRCFNLCESFPTLFDLIDESQSGELDTVQSEGFKEVADNCTLCDLCFMTKCPYVPPHEFDLDFPHLMLRYKAVEQKKGETSWISGQLSETDRNGKIASVAPGLVNWANHRDNKYTRPILEKVAGIDSRTEIPQFHGKTFLLRAQDEKIVINTTAPAYGRKAVLYATCFVNYNNPDLGMTARRLLAHFGIETEVVYPGCCGMPQFEQGRLPQVATSAQGISEAMKPWIDLGYDIVALVPSCALMMKFEWPLLLPENGTIQKLAESTLDLSEYIMTLQKSEGLPAPVNAISDPVTLHIACHARAQNMGRKAEEMLKLIPEIQLNVIERCSGHGGTWGFMKEHYEVALKVGKPVAQEALKYQPAVVTSECPLAATHIAQGLEVLEPSQGLMPTQHPLEILARAYGVL